MLRTPIVLICTAIATTAAATPAGAAPFPIHDTVLKPGRAHVSALPPFKWTAPDGHVITLQLSRSIGNSPAAVEHAESYAALLETKRHNFEMSALKIRIVRASELKRICGAGALACYGSDEMVVPYGETSGAPLEEVITHEYGHHVAAHRRNSMGAAVEWGPQSWASAESVCLHTDEGKLFPGDEWDHYWENPGEGWAEAYARFHYPAGGWDYSRLLKPDQRTFDEIAFDVDHNLSRSPSQAVFQGALNRARRSQTFSLDLSQDSALRLALRGPRGTDYDLRLMTPGYYDETTDALGSGDRLNTSACFEEGAQRRVKISVTRREGSGPFTLKLSYFDTYDELR